MMECLQGNIELADICGMGLRFTADGFRLLLTGFALFLWAGSMILTKSQVKSRRPFFFWTSAVVLAGAIGVFLAADLFTLYLFFELMSLGSALWVFHNGGEEQRRAGFLYMTVAVIGGLFLLCGILLLYGQFGTLHIEALAILSEQQAVGGALYPACVFLLLGFAAKAGAVPLHFWMPAAYAAAPAPATALLSAVLSKTGIFGIVIVSTKLLPGDAAWGRGLLLIGLVTMLVGGVRAAFATEMKTLLACSSMSHMGILLLAVALVCLSGMEGALAARGLALHMITHGLSKAVLFWMSGVAEAEGTGTRFDQLQGLGANRPWVRASFLTAACSLAGVPLLGGYASKTLIHEALVHGLEAGLLTGELLFWAERLFLLGGGLTVLYLLRLYFGLFPPKKDSREVEKSRGRANNPAAPVVLPCCAILLLMGLLPALWDRLLDLGTDFFLVEPLEHWVAYLSLHNLESIAISLFLGVVLYGLSVWLAIRRDGRGRPRHLRRLPVWLSLERSLYRPLFERILPALGYYLAVGMSMWVDWALDLLGRRLFHGQWDRESKPARGAAFGRYPAADERRPGQHSLTWTLLLFALGICLMVAAVCGALIKW